ncbi:hypothetical protein CMMCAS02_07840 [Clavibacter michiganensis subsp. michiganensis]|nr:hypothetical protein CMMCAS02_07840 [Clavibacter michiganensis subsp. michiganensis]OUE16077.1 hypothetical protein CMMCA002_07965 [Clavibacter michiganensis subsp. michiganensis]
MHALGSWDTARLPGGFHGTHRRERGSAQVLLLREEPEAGPAADRGTGRLHLRRVRGALQRDHRGAPGRSQRGDHGRVRAAQAEGDLRLPRRVRHRAGGREASPVRRGLQPLQARACRQHHRAGRDRGRRDRDRQEQHPPHRAHRLRQDLPGSDAGEASQRALRRGRRDGTHRGGLRRRGRREHPAEAHPGRRLRREAGRDRHHLHRRGRQDRAQGREPEHHARRVGRGRAAGAAEDPRGHGGLGPAAGRPQAPAPGVHPGRHDQRAVHRRGRVRGARGHHQPARGQEGHRLRRPAAP